MISLQALKEYNDDIKTLCSAMDDDTIDFFEDMRKAGINFYNDTNEHRDASIGFIVKHMGWMSNVYQYLVQNRPLEYDSELWESIPDTFQLSPQELYDTLLVRSAKTQEEVLKLSCPQSLITKLLTSLKTGDLSGFLTTFETNMIDMTNISKFLSLSNLSQIPSAEESEEIKNLWLECASMRRREVYDTCDTQMPEDLLATITHNRYLWLYDGILSKDDITDSQMLFILQDRMNTLQCALQSPQNYSEEEYVKSLSILWEFFAKAIIIEIPKLPQSIRDRIRPTFAPYYLHPIIDKYEKEWEDILKQEHELVKPHMRDEEDAPVIAFSLPDDFFTQEITNGSKHMSLRDEIKREGVHKFEKLLIALSEYGYVDKEALPLLAYRLTGRGNVFEETKIVWHKDSRVIRHMIARMHDAGHYISVLNDYFVNDSGETFLNTITADVARNIKSYSFYKKVLYPLYGNLMK